MAEENNDEYLVLKTVDQLDNFLEEFEYLMEQNPEKKDLAITHQAYSEEFSFFQKDDVWKKKAGKFLLKGPQPGKRLIDTQVADLFRKYADLSRSEGCDRLGALFEAHAVIYEMGYGSTLSYGLVEEMRQHFLPGDTSFCEN